ncbi:MAG: outer membrane beta-barrel protein [Methylococcales bacterium]|nr:outer membrane beta-barrel protein [Methylococcales bacterium]
MKQYLLNSAFIIVGLLGFQANAHSEHTAFNQNGHWYLSAAVGFVGTDDVRGGNGVNFNIGVGKIINRHFNIELKGIFNSLGKTYIDQERRGIERCSFDTDTGIETCTTDDGRTDDLKLGGAAIDLQYFFYRDRFSPYLVGSVGMLYTKTNIAQKSTWGLISELGAGVTLDFGDEGRFKLFSDIRYRYNNNFNTELNFGKDELHDILINFGLMFVL